MSLTPLPTPPARTDPPAIFVPKADAYLGAFPLMQTELNSLQSDVAAKQALATTSANTAVSAASTAATSSMLAQSAAGATMWVSGQNYAQGATAISGINFQAYRRKVAGSGTVDPYNDGTNWLPALYATGGGGATTTGSITLTSTSPGANVVTPATPGLYLTLPDSTTLAKGVGPFSIYNAGDYDYGVKDSTGKQLGWVRPRSGALIGLADNTTAAGVWSLYGLRKTGTTASYFSSTIGTSYSGLRVVQIDATRTLFMPNSTPLYAIVYNSATQSWGNLTLIAGDAVQSSSTCILSAANQILAIYATASSLSYAVTLSITGTTITVNTPVSSGLGTSGGGGPLVAVGSSFVYSYNSQTASPTGRIVALQISGTVPSWGTPATLANINGGATNLYVTGNIVRTLSYTTATSYTIVATPYTVSGVTLTIGTGVTISGLQNNPSRFFQSSTGDLLAVYILATGISATVFKLTGTTETANSVLLSSNAPADTPNSSDIIQISANKILVTWSVVSNPAYASLITVTSSVPTASTTFVNGSIASNPYIRQIVPVVVTGNSVKLIASSSDNLVGYSFTVDCSTANPVITSSNTLTANFSTLTVSDYRAIKNPALLVTGVSAYLLTGLNDIHLTDKTLLKTEGLSLQTYQPQGTANATINNSTSIYQGLLTGGFTLQIVEAAE